MNHNETKIKHRYFVINKPLNMVSQFVSPHKVGLLADLNYQFPEGTHAIGRLDNNSEGLLLLTTDKKITRLLFSGKVTHERVYLVQVNNLLKETSLHQLRNGVAIRIEGGGYYITPPCEITIIEHPEKLYPFINSSEQHGASTWLLIKLYEGKYRQVRKMISAVHHRCKRLIRISIEDMCLENLPPGFVKEINEEIFFKKLKLKNDEYFF